MGSTSENERKRELREFDVSKSGMQGLAKSGLQTIPRIFIDEHYMLERKSSIPEKHEFSFPVIDLGCPNTGRGRIVDQVREACGDWGFFKIVNHGIPTSLMEEAIGCVRRFHELEPEAKTEYYSRDFKKKVMYHSNYDLHHAPSANWRDTLYLNMAPHLPQPHELPQVCRGAMVEYLEQLKKLGLFVLELMSEALGLNSNHLKEMECGEEPFVACHYYPSCPEPDLTLGINSHTDSCFLALLLQDEIGGLQVRHRNQWVDVPPSPGALIANVGDLMELISNSKFKSVHHRVLATNAGPRTSLAYFFRSSNILYGPIKELLSEENPPIYREATGREIGACQLKCRVDGVPILCYFRLNDANSSN